MMGDEGGGYWIAYTALKHMFDHDDGLVKCEHSVEYIRREMKEYFHVDTNLDMLRHLYTDFKKSFLAGFGKKVAEGAVEGDALCQAVLRQAGLQLAKHIIAVGNRCKPKPFPQGCTLVCMGSVWKSWKYLSESFQGALADMAENFNGIKVVQLRNNGTIGAAVAGARDSGFTVPIDHDKHTVPVCHIGPK